MSDLVLLLFAVGIGFVLGWMAKPLDQQRRRRQARQRSIGDEFSERAR